LATDFFHDKAYPSYLYYNPYNENKMVSIDLEKGKNIDLYNTVSGQFIARDISSSTRLKLSPRSASIIVIIPAAGTVTYAGEKMMVNGITVDYKYQRKK